MEKKEQKVEFFISNIGGKENTEIIDLNKIFQMNFSYNFDLLKNLIETLMKNQKNFQTDLKEKNSKIVSLENQILDLKIASNNLDKEKSVDKRIQYLEISKEVSEQLNPKLISIIKGEKDILKPPPNDIKLEVSHTNDDKINNIIVRKNNLNFFIYIYRKK